MSMSSGKKKRRYLSALKRRADYLQQRISTKPPESTSYDRAEAAALNWAIDTIEGLLGTEQMEEYATDRKEETQ